MTLALGAAPALAEQQQRAVRIEYEAPPTCPDEARFYAAVRSRTPLVRRAQGDEPATTLEVHIELQQNSAAGELQLIEAGTRVGRRRVTGATCEEVVSALGLSAALSIDPEALLRSDSGPAAASSDAARERPAVAPPAEPKTSELSSQRDASDLSPQRDAREPSVRTALGGRLIVGQVVTPGVGVGGGLSSLIELDRRWSVRLGLSHTRQGQDNASFARSSADLSGCVRLDVGGGIVSLLPCARFEGGWLDASGHELVSRREVRRSYWAAGVELVAQLRVGGRWFAEVGGAALVPLIERRYEIGQPAREIATTALPTPSAHLGLGYWLGSGP